MKRNIAISSLAIAISACFFSEATLAENLVIGEKEIYTQDIENPGLTNKGVITNNITKITGPTFDNYSGVINTKTLVIDKIGHNDVIGGVISATERVVYYGTGGNCFGKELSATVTTKELYIEDKYVKQTGLSVAKQEVINGIERITLHSRGGKTGLVVKGANLDFQMPIYLVEEANGAQDSRIEIQNQSIGDTLHFSKIVQVSGKGKVQVNGFGDVSIDNLELKQDSTLSLQALAVPNATQQIYRLSTISVDNNARLNASVYQDGQPDIYISGDIDINLGNNAIVDFGGEKNPDWRDQKIFIDATSITVNVSDSERTGVVYLTKKNTDLTKTKVTVTADGINNSGNAQNDLEKLKDVVQLTEKTDYTSGSSKFTASGITLVQKADDFHDGSSTTVIGNADGTSSIGTISYIANSNIYGIAEMNSLGLHIWRNEINDMNKRLGELRDSKQNANGIWARVYTGEAEIGSQSVTNEYVAFQFGYDRQIVPNIFLGAAFSYTEGNNDFSIGGGDNNIYALTAYGSYVANNGLFLDFTAKYGWLENEFDIALSDGVRSKGDYDADAFSVSAEAGWRFGLTDLLFIEPQIEMMYGQVESVNYTTSTGIDVKHDRTDTFIGRAGFVLGINCPDNKGNAYIRASLLHDFEGQAKYSFGKNGSMRSLEDDLGGTWYEFGIGANINLTDNIHSYLDVEASTSGEVETNYRVNAGIRYSF